MDTYSYASTLPIEGEATQCLWAISGDDPRKTSATQVAQRMNIRMTQPNLIWNPLTGEMVEMIRGTRENRLHHATRKMFTILVVADHEVAFTDYPDQNLLEILERIPGTIPNVWPMGPPDFPIFTTPPVPITPGHYTEDQVLTNGKSVGRIDIRRLRRQA